MIPPVSTPSVCWFMKQWNLDQVHLGGMFIVIIDSFHLCSWAALSGPWIGHWVSQVGGVRHPPQGALNLQGETGSETNGVIAIEVALCMCIHTHKLTCTHTHTPSTMGAWRMTSLQVHEFWRNSDYLGNPEEVSESECSMSPTGRPRADTQAVALHSSSGHCAENMVSPNHQDGNKRVRFSCSRCRRKHSPTREFV